MLNYIEIYLKKKILFFISLDKKFISCYKNDDFDKKEFVYCKKMLMMKRNENLKDVKSDIPEKIAPIPVYTEVEKEANVNYY